MYNILSIEAPTPGEVAKTIAWRVKQRRLEMNLTQAGLATRAGIKTPTYRRFERTGQISLKGLLYIAFALNMLADFDQLFSQRQYQSLDDILNETEVKHKRGSLNE